MHEFTREGYFSAINTHIMGYFGKMRMEDITRQSLLEFRNVLRDKRTTKSKEHRRSSAGHPNCKPRAYSAWADPELRV